MNLKKTNNGEAKYIINLFACECKASHFKVVIHMSRVTKYSWHDRTNFFRQCCTLKRINKNLCENWHQTSAFLTGRENAAEIIHDGRAWVQWNLWCGMQVLLPHTVSFLVCLNLRSSCWFRLVQTEPEWSQRDLTGPYLSQPVQTGLHQPRLIQTGLHQTRPNQTSVNQNRADQTSLNQTRMV